MKTKTKMRYYPVRFKLFGSKEVLVYDSRDTDYVRAANRLAAKCAALRYLHNWHSEWTDADWDTFDIEIGRSSSKCPKDFELIINDRRI